jgi:glycolate oxidase iron-sulfur subunit
MFSEEIKEDLHHCIKCGLCQAVCPTFKATKLEHYTPRGRLQILKHYLEGDLGITPEFEEAVLSCILCDACAAFCPSGVRIDRLFRNMRGDLAELVRTGLDKKALFALLTSPALMRRGARIARMGQRLLVDFLSVSMKLGNIPIDRLPRFNHRSFRSSVPEKITASGKRTGRVLYFTGCATDLIHGDVGHAVLEVLGWLGIEVIVPKDQLCCAAPIFLSGFHRVALPNIERNLEIFDRDDVDAIVVDCATCGAALKKDIPELLQDLGRDPSKAIRVASKVKDISQVVVERLGDLAIGEPRTDESLRVTYHDPCHLVRGMGVTAEPRMILSALPGIDFTEMEDPGECCGGGGSYQFERTELSGAITSAKTDRIRSTRARIVATGCPGCRLTLAGNLREESDPEVMHTIQLLARALAYADNRR